MGTDMRAMVLIGGLLGLPAKMAWAADDVVCPASPAAIVDTADAITTAFKNMAPDALRVQHAHLVEQESCLDAVPTPAQVAQIYKGEALFASSEARHADAERWLHAMVEADPSATLPFDVAREGTQLQNQLRGVRQSPARPRTPVAITTGYTLLLDGVPTALRSTDRTALYLILDDRGQVWKSGLLPAGAPVPDPPPLANGRHPWPKALLVAEGSTLAVAAGLWAVALVDRGRVNRELDTISERKEAGLIDGGMAPADLQRLAGVTNGLGTGAVGATSLAIGLAVVGFTVRW